ncbi:MAG: H/ACA ribonucleoprotein complex subunit GAR1 [Promethearchaeota archaeon]
MRRLNKVLHLSNQKHLILRVKSNQMKNLKINQTVVTKDLNKIGRIFDIFGPVNNPFISIQPSSQINEPEKLVGKILYGFDEKKSYKKKVISRR